MNIKKHKKDKYIVDEIFTKEINLEEDNIQEQIENLRKRGYHYRVKTIKSGNILESEIYPIWDNGSNHRLPRGNNSRQSQRNLNNKNTIKKLIRLLNCNFTDNDIWATFTYDNNHLPSSIEEAQKNMVNYLRRLKTYVKKHNFEELKYIYVTEYDDSDSKKIRVHHHIVMNFKDRDVAEKMWNGGSRTQSKRLQPDDFGLEGLARYILKDPRGKKRYTVSKNLSKPIITIADSKMSRAKVLKIVEKQIDAKQFFTSAYKGYYFTDMKISFSDYVAGAYLYVRMKC